jgi:hypothetical protein
MEHPIDPLLSHQVLTESSSVFQKKATGLTRGLHVSEQRPRAALMACPGPHFSSSDVLTEEGRPVRKAKKAKTKETNLLSTRTHDSLLPFLRKKSIARKDFILLIFSMFLLK